MYWLFKLIAWFTPRFIVRALIEHYRPALVTHAKQYPYYDLPGYMRRWWVFKNFFGWSARVHETLRSDLDRHLHDHPWDNVSIVLDNGYWEITPRGRKWRGIGDIVVRRAEDSHRLELVGPAVSLFLIGPKRRPWGFQTEEGWVYWKRYVDPRTLSPEEIAEIQADGEPAAR